MTAPAQDVTRSYPVRGMTCAHCVAAVTAELTALDAVTGVHVDLASGRVEVTSARPLDDGAVRAAVEEAGYEVADKT